VISFRSLEGSLGLIDTAFCDSYCAFMLPDGRRTFRSTKKKDRKEAWDLCRAWEKAAESAGRGSLTEVQARKVLNEILEAIGEGPVRNVSVREFFLNWLTGKQLSKKDTTGRRYKKAVEEFVDSLGPKADKSIVALTPADALRSRHGSVPPRRRTLRTAFQSHRSQPRNPRSK
jgi:hypothetical protein